MRKSLAAAVAALLTTAIPASADAAITISSYGFSDSYRTGTLYHSPTGTSVNAGIGRFALSGSDQATAEQVNFLSFCLDIFNPLHTGTFMLQALSSLLSDPIKLSQINALLSNAEPMITGANSSAAVQLAIWEIYYETGSGAYDLNSGAFRVTGTSSATARTTANGWLNSVLNGTWTADPRRGLFALYAPDNQTQLVSAPIPEPATWAMMISGLGLVGAGIRRRRTTAMTVIA